MEREENEVTDNFFDILAKFQQAYTQRLAQIDNDNEAAKDIKMQIMMEWINDLNAQNSLLLQILNDLENAAHTRVQVLQKKLESTSENLTEWMENGQPTVDQKLQEITGRIDKLILEKRNFQERIDFLRNDLNNLLLFIRRGHTDNVWTTDDLNFHEIDKKSIVLPNQYENPKSFRCDEKKKKESEEMVVLFEKKLQEKTEEIVSLKSSFSSKISSKEEEILDLKTELSNMALKLQEVEQNHEKILMEKEKSLEKLQSNNKMTTEGENTTNFIHSKPRNALENGISVVDSAYNSSEMFHKNDRDNLDYLLETIASKDKLIRDREVIIQIQQDSLKLTQEEVKQLHHQLQIKEEETTFLGKDYSQKTAELAEQVHLQSQTIKHLQDALVEAKKVQNRNSAKSTLDLNVSDVWSSITPTVFNNGPGCPSLREVNSPISLDTLQEYSLHHQLMKNMEQKLYFSELVKRNINLNVRNIKHQDVQLRKEILGDSDQIRSKVNRFVEIWTINLKRMKTHLKEEKYKALNSTKSCRCQSKQCKLLKEQIYVFEKLIKRLLSIKKQADEMAFRGRKFGKQS